jgi:SMI1/KNR4 family protein SUKH-1
VADIEATVRVWRSIGPAERDLVEASGWRAWPRLPEQLSFSWSESRESATGHARQRLVPREGVGYVMFSDVRTDHLTRIGVDQTDGDVRRIPAEHLTDWNANLVGAIQEAARYAAPASISSLTALAQHAQQIGGELPPEWRDYLQAPSSWVTGWLPNGIYLQLFRPEESIEATRVWTEDRDRHPGVLLIGGDGAGELLALDLRDPTGGVFLLPNVSEGWADRIRQADTIVEFIDEVESGTYEFRFEA